MLKLAHFIDSLNENVGNFNAFLILPLLGVVGFEVIMRYGFNAPTIWAFEATTLLYGVHFMLAFAHAHKHNGHVAIDVFEARLPKRPRTILRIVINLVLFIPTIGLLSIWSVIYAASSWSNWELASTSWAPPFYPFKTIMAIGFILLFLQGIAKLIQDFYSLKGSADATEIAP
ncbi:MAG: TRAP transporter small permease subunit [Candidatus Competibacteraceae bacterium]|jgi:TRAP-type mannitol/chloroaromatic compound transport system permease small subunit|nr:TRAP transporter small permease subunit [Candidatus Competibacteraceae bacterium]